MTEALTEHGEAPIQGEGRMEDNTYSSALNNTEPAIDDHRKRMALSSDA
jgi:hypothetical protein